MSVITQENITQKFIAELSAVSPKADFMPFEKIAAALKYLEDDGIPNNKHEEYKYCNIESIIRKEFKSLTNTFSKIDKADIQKYKTDATGIYVFVLNGIIDEENSDLKHTENGLTIVSLTNASQNNSKIFKKHLGTYANENKDAFIALNTAFCGNGIFIHVEKNAVIEKTIHLIYLDSAKENVNVNFRKLFVAEENSHVKISEIFETINLPAKIFSNHLCEFFIGERALVDSVIVQAGDENFYCVNTMQIFQQKKSKFSIHSFTFGGSLVRNNLNIVVAGENSETYLNGLTFAKENQLVDNHTVVDHTVPNCESHELYKGVAMGKSVLVFNGKIFVRANAQKTNAYQSSKNILLSDEATVNTKPQLEIFADDVKCSHGTSTGKVDEEALFYLKARGIGEAAAKKLLLRAFAIEVIEKIKNNFLRELIEIKFNDTLG